MVVVWRVSKLLEERENLSSCRGSALLPRDHQQCLPILLSRRAEEVPCCWHVRCCESCLPLGRVSWAGGTRTWIFRLSCVKNRIFSDIINIWLFLAIEKRLSIHTTDELMWSQRPTEPALLLLKSSNSD